MNNIWYEVSNLYETVCEDCGKLFFAKSNKAFYCPRCVSKRLSKYAKERNLNKIGNEARKRA